MRAGGPLPLYIIAKVRLTLEILGRSVLLLELVLGLQCTVKFTPSVVGSKVSVHAQ